MYDSDSRRVRTDPNKAECPNYYPWKKKPNELVDPVPQSVEPVEKKSQNFPKHSSQSKKPKKKKKSTMYDSDFG